MIAYKGFEIGLLKHAILYICISDKNCSTSLLRFCLLCIGYWCLKNNKIKEGQKIDLPLFLNLVPKRQLEMDTLKSVTETIASDQGTFDRSPTKFNYKS